jgi:hypothetical protein
MSPEYFLRHALEPALAMLPPKMDTPAARAEVIAIGLQESRFEKRHQMRGGPAHGYHQFEQGGGVLGVLRHPATRGHIATVMQALDYDPDPWMKETVLERMYHALEHNDILDAAFSRLLLFSLPDQMPARNAPALGYTLYLNAWRPGSPIRVTWAPFFEQAWDIVT